MRSGGLGVAALCLVASLPFAAHAQVPDGDPKDLPVLSEETPRGTADVVTVDGPAPQAKTIDGDPSDWVGESSMFGGTAIYSAGELVYQDHIFDAYGPDDGRDTARFERTDVLEENVPGAYRIDGLAQSDPPGQLGAPSPEQFTYNDTYGDAVDHQDNADLAEVRVATGSGTTELLARTTTMETAASTALLVVADTTAGDTPRAIPFNSNLTTAVGEVAFFVADGTVLRADLSTGEISTAGSAIANPAGFANVIEASLPLTDATSLAVASGTPTAGRDGFADLTIETAANDDPHANVANVAFRTNEPVRVWFEKQQGLALHQGTIDPFFLKLDGDLLASGTSQRYVPGHGYHDRIFLSDTTTGVPREGGVDGIYQHYGVYLPSAYDGTTELPLQWWLHWRGGTAHSGAAIVSKVMHQFGEDRDTMVVAPSGRGTSTWYVGKGHVDVLEVWADLFDTFPVDDDRVYSTGHSMGGWGSYLLTLLYPDRFAAAAPVAGPVTQGAWTGVDYFEGCEDMSFDEYTPCYISANGSDPIAQHTRKLLENSLHVPYAILHGTSDELVPYSGVFRQHERLLQLGYRNRMYTYPGYEHFTHPIVDQWAEAASYLHRFTRPENPARVVYKRDLPFERATETVQSGGVALNFDFDSAYWMSELSVAEGFDTASFDGRSLAIPETPHLAVPDTGPPVAPGQTGPYVVTGLQWIDDPAAEAAAPVNGFDITLLGSSKVQLDLERMDIDPTQPIAGSVDARDAALSLRLDGGWTKAPDVLLDGAPTTATLSDGVLTIEVPQGAHTLTITPNSDAETTATQLTFTEASATGGQYSDSATLVARLTAAGEPIAGESVAFRLGSSSVDAVTDDHGVATATFELTEAPGETAVTAAYAGTDTLLPSLASAPFTIERENTLTDLAVEGKGSKRTLVATLVDADSGTGIGGRTITFAVDGETLGTAVTDGTGRATFAVPARYSGPQRSFTASFAGDEFYEGSKG